jgi:hypothetical protein
VAGFRADSVCLLEGLLLLGKQERVPFGIESISREGLDKRVSFRIPSATLQTTIGAILAEFKGHSFRLEHGVVLVRADDLKPERVSFLNLVLPRVLFQGAPLRVASNAVWMLFDQQVHPETRGYAGSIPGAQLHGKPVSLDLKNQTLRVVLDHLAAAYEDAAWIAIPLPAGRTLEQAGTQHRWALFEYDIGAFNRHVVEIRDELRAQLQE